MATPVLVVCLMLELPPLSSDVLTVAGALREGLGEILGDVLSSLFLYGAVAFPRPERWAIDFDFHVLLERPLAGVERDAITALYERLARLSPLGADLDGYFVLLADARRPEPPRHQLDLAVRDEAWALHRAHVHAGRSFTITGIDPITVVPEPSWAELEAALRAELGFVKTHPQAPAFGIVNGARILASFATRDVVLSKYQAAQWALSSLPDEWHEAVGAAARWYEQTADEADAATLVARWRPFVAFVERSIPAT
jgi:hypothetical protein